ncbi:MAG: homoserine dehydrogenase [Firmicutes bacterium]|nr:homoserine dehydrogenase [Bacillota bacterium]
MKIAILGLGVVGRGVYDLILKNHPSIEIAYVLELDKEKCKDITVPIATDYQSVLDDKNVDVIVELIGGVQLTFDLVKRALKAKKHVVTANKALISAHFKELTDLAQENDVIIRFEASVGGGIIILNPLDAISKINDITEIKGIINGSTNYVLSKMFMEHYTLEEAIDMAYQNGYLETGSNDDMAGLDLMRKINILSSISFHSFFLEHDIFVHSLEKLNTDFIRFLQTKNWVLKFVGSAIKINNEVMISAEPVIVKSDHLYTHYNYEQNIVELIMNGDMQFSFTGPGAGRYQTASAVIYDLLQTQKANPLGYSFENNLISVNNDLIKYRYLIQLEKGIISSPFLTKTEVQPYLYKAIYYARIGGDIDEEI